MSIASTNALRLRNGIRSGDFSAKELVSEALRAAESQRGLGAFVSMNPELALAEAATIDDFIARTQVTHASHDSTERGGLPPLLGVPTAHKDLVKQRGHVTTHGSRAVPHLVADIDDPIAKVVRESGAISIGKTQVPEFGIGGYSENDVAAPARNPFNDSVTAGGSSGGSASAIAAGIIPAAVCSDAGGSIRIPAAACGLIGLKPGRGVVPADRPPHTAAQGEMPPMGVSGPIARTAHDAALLFDVLLGKTEEPTVTAVERADELRNLRIGVSLASPFESWLDIHFSRDSLDALAAATTALEHAGHHVEESTIRYDDTYPGAFTTVWTSALARMELSPSAESQLGDLARMYREQALATSPAKLADATQQLMKFAADAGRQWGEYDLVLTPALAFSPPAIGAFAALGPEGDYRLQCEWAPQTSMVNVVGLPAITVPTHWLPGGQPMGVQLIGRQGSEVQLLQLAQQLTQPRT